MKKAITLIFILLLVHVSCACDASRQYTYRLPENINDGFAVGSLDEVNIDSELIEKAVKNIHQGIYKEVHSMLIVKDGKLVFEEYFEGPSLTLWIISWVFISIGLIALIVLIVYTKYGREISIRLSVITIVVSSIFLGFAFHFLLLQAGY